MLAGKCQPGCVVKGGTAPLRLSLPQVKPGAGNQGKRHTSMRSCHVTGAADRHVSGEETLKCSVS